MDETGQPGAPTPGDNGNGAGPQGDQARPINGWAADAGWPGADNGGDPAGRQWRQPAEPVPDSLPADPALAELSAMAGAPGDEPRRREAVEPRSREALEARLREAADPKRRAPVIEDFDAAWPARQPPQERYGGDAPEPDRSRPMPPRGRRPSRDD